jgi:transposase
LRGLSTKELVSVTSRFRLGEGPRDVPTATKFALRSLARRYEALSKEIAELEAHLDRLVAQAAPELVSLPGIGTDNAATLLIVAGDNPQRLKSEASFASLCGVSPIEASSGKVVRHRLNRGGKPGGQPCVVHDLSVPDAPRSAHAGIRCKAHRGGQEQARSSAA